MDLYFSPLACSLATRIALYEAGAEANYLEVDPKTKVVQNDGSDFRQVNPLGLVPTLRTDDGLVLTENAAILQYVADRFPQAGIATGPGMERSRLHQWLCFIGTELHKGLFVPVLDKKAPPEVKTYVLEQEPVAARLSREVSEGPRIPARPFQRRRRLPRHRHQLDHGDAADRAGEMAGREGLLRAAARAAEHRQGGRPRSSSCTRPNSRATRRRRRTRSCPGRWRAPFDVALASGHRSAVACICDLDHIGLQQRPQRLRDRLRAALADEGDAHLGLDQQLVAAPHLLRQRDRGALHLRAARSRRRARRPSARA